MSERVVSRVEVDAYLGLVTTSESLRLKCLRMMIGWDPSKEMVRSAHAFERFVLTGSIDDSTSANDAIDASPSDIARRVVCLEMLCCWKSTTLILDQAAKFERYLLGSTGGEQLDVAGWADATARSSSDCHPA